MNITKTISTAALAAMMVGFTACCTTTATCEKSAATCGEVKEIQQVNNADFYDNGVFNAQKAKDAYFQMMKNVGAPIYKRYTEDPNFLWAVDFKKGDFAAFGMGGVFWVNERKEEYFGHEIFLLPGQSIAEHKHLPTEDQFGPLQAKCESWQVRYGWVYGFSEIGEPNLDKYPEVKALLSKVLYPEHLNSVHVEKWEADGQVHKLPKIGSWHFMMGGDKGAVVTEYATYHDGNGLRFSVPDVGF